MESAAASQTNRQSQTNGGHNQAREMNEGVLRVKTSGAIQTNTSGSGSRSSKDYGSRGTGGKSSRRPYSMSDAAIKDVSKQSELIIEHH